MSADNDTGRWMALVVNLSALGSTVYCAHIGEWRVALGILAAYAGSAIVAAYTRP